MKSLKEFLFAVILAILTLGIGAAHCEPVTVDISSAAIQVIGGPFTYTGSQITPDLYVTLDGIPLVSYGLNFGYFNCVYAGTCTVSVSGSGNTFTDPVLGEVKYIGTAETTFEIEKAKVTVNFPSSDPGLVYNGQAQGIAWSVSGEVTPGEAGAYILYTGPESPPNRAANYLATVRLTNTANYQIEGAYQYNFEIHPKPVTVNFPAGPYSEWVYDGTVHTVDFSVSGEVTPGDALAYIEYSAISTSLPPKDAGSYRAFLRLSNANYQISGGWVHDFTITKRPLTVVFSGGPAYTYNAQEQRPGWQITGEAAGEHPVMQAVLTGTYPEPKNTGVYTLTVSFNGDAVNRNYQIAGENERVFSIGRAPVTFTFPDADPHYTYNAQAQTILWSVSDPVAGEDPAVGVHYYISGTGTPTVSAGSHSAVCYLDYSNPVNQNYEIQGQFSFAYTIAPAPVTVTFPASDPGYVYNGQVQTVPVSVSDPVHGEDPDYQILYYQYAMPQEPRNAGPYMVWVYMPYNPVNVNYQLTGDDRFEFFIRQRQLTVTPAAKEKLLGTDTPDPLLEYTVSGQLAGDAPVFQGELYCDWREAPGEYAIMPGFLWLVYYDPANLNYSYDYQFTQGVSFTIRELEKAPDATLVPGGPNGDNGWYISPVRLMPPSGYLISRVQSTGASNWQPYLERSDGIYGPDTYYLRRESDGAITSAKQMPSYNQDGRAPTISSAVVSNVNGNPPGLQITAGDNVLLEKIVVFDGGKPVRTRNLADMHTDRYTIVHPFLKPGSYNAAAYDAAGNMSLKTVVVTVSDTDGDGLSDDWEVWQGTDPGKKDSDSDGVEDGFAYLLGEASDGRLPAAAALLLNAPAQDADGEGIPAGFYGSGLVDGVADVREEDVKNAPKLDDSAAIVQFDPAAGEGWALSGGMLVHFAPQGDSFACDTVFALEGAFGALKLVALSSADGSVMLLAHWNETEGRIEGPLRLLDTNAKKVSVLSGSDGASAFDLSQDGARVAFAVGGRVHVVNIVKGTMETSDHDASALTFTLDGRLALGMEGSNVLFYEAGVRIASQAYNGFVDASQRTNTTRSVSVVSGGSVSRVDVNGQLTFSEDGKRFVFASFPE